MRRAIRSAGLAGLATLILSTLLATAAWAANLDKLAKKLPEAERAVFMALRIFMTEEEQTVYLGNLRTPEERQKFLEDTGYWQKWERLQPEQQQAIALGRVLPGFDRDALYMAWGKAYKIRKDVEDGVYVDVLYYRWEKDKKGREFVSFPDSPSGYRNESFDKLVYFANGLLVDVVKEGEERRPNLRPGDAATAPDPTGPAAPEFDLPPATGGMPK